MKSSWSQIESHLHDLRRSFGTLSEWVEMPDGIVNQIQGHKPSGTAAKHRSRAWFALGEVIAIL